MTGQSLLNIMELLDQELQNQSGEANVTRSLLALNVSQDYFESLAAQRSKLFGGQTGTLSAVANEDTTVFPTSLLRIDRLQMLDSTTLRPQYDLMPDKRAGAHIGSAVWLDQSTTGTGNPRTYWTDGNCIYWSPVPSETRSIKYYGFISAADITAAKTFAYKDIVALPIASFAVRLIKSGVDDTTQDMTGLANETFKQVLDQMSNFRRDGAAGFEYTQVHNT